jgi:hypothetical protein
VKNQEEPSLNYPDNLAWLVETQLRSNRCLQTRDTSSQQNEGDSIDEVLKEYKEAKMTSNIANNSCAEADHGNGNNKAIVTICQSCVG